VLGGDAPADAVARLDNGHLPAALSQQTAGCQTRNARSEYQGIVFDSALRALAGTALGSRLFH
jgi:hypothetical protein